MAVRLKAKPATPAPEGPPVPEPIIPPAEADKKGKKEKKKPERDKKYFMGHFCDENNPMARALDQICAMPITDYDTTKKILELKREIVKLREKYHEHRTALIKSLGEPAENGKDYSVQPTTTGKDKKPAMNPKFVEFQTEMTKLNDEPVKWTHLLVVIPEAAYRKALAILDERKGVPPIPDQLIIAEGIIRVK